MCRFLSVVCLSGADQKSDWMIIIHISESMLEIDTDHVHKCTSNESSPGVSLACIRTQKNIVDPHVKRQVFAAPA